MREYDCDDYGIHDAAWRDAMEYDDDWDDPYWDVCPDCNAQDTCECWRDDMCLEDQLDYLLGGPS